MRKEVTLSSNPCLKASSSLLNVLIAVLKEYCLMNSGVRSSQVLYLDGSNSANQCCARTLKDNGNKASKYTSSLLRGLMTKA